MIHRDALSGNDISIAAAPIVERRPFFSGRRKVDRRFQLHLITDRKACAGDLLTAVRHAVGHGVDWVQVREKSAPALEVYEMCRRVRQICRETRAGLIVNDRIDVALALQADGVHLAKKSLPPGAARSLLTPSHLLGCSIHGLDDAIRLAPSGADYLTFGNVFATRSHPGSPAKGVDVLRAIVQAVDLPILAVGGITVHNVADVLATGCAGVAVIGAILGALDPAEATARLRRALDAHPAQPRRPFPVAARSSEPHRETLKPR
jgi:thiamine-phosphate pyrophosphorylase